MLCDSKRQAIIHWFNSLNPTSIENLQQLQDGNYFCNILKPILDPQTICRGAENKNSRGFNFMKESEAEENFTIIKKFIDESFQIKSESLICYEDCQSGNELELAKVAIFMLSVLVQNLLSKNGNQQLNLMGHLEITQQQEIVECMSFILDHSSGEMRKAEIHRILHRPAKHKETPRRLKGTSPSQTSLSPDNRFITPQGRGRRKVSGTPQSLEVTRNEASPVQTMLESPKLTIWATVKGKDQEIMMLRRELHATENKVIDQRMLLEDLRKQLGNKTQELDQLKEQIKKNQSEADEIWDRNHSLDERMTIKEIKHTKTEEIYKTEVKILSDQIETWKSLCSDLDKKLQGYQNIDKSAAANELLLTEVQLQLQQSEEKCELQAKMIEKLEDDIKELNLVLSVYKDKLLEKEKKEEHEISKLANLELGEENVGSILEEDLRQKVTQLQKLVKELSKKPENIGKSSYYSGFRNMDKNGVDGSIDVSNENSGEKQSQELRHGVLWVNYDEEKSMDVGNGNDNSQIDLDQVLQSVCESKKDDEKENILKTTLADIFKLARDVFVAFSSNRCVELPFPDDLESFLNGISGPIESANFIKQMLEKILRERSAPSRMEGSEKSIICDMEKSEDVSMDSGVNLCPSENPTLVCLLHKNDNLTQKNNELSSLCEDLKAQLEKSETEKEALLEKDEKLHHLINELKKAKEEQESKNDELRVELTQISEKIKKHEEDLKRLAEQRNYTGKKYIRLKDYTCDIEKKLKVLEVNYETIASELKAKQNSLKEAENSVKELRLIANQERELKQKHAAKTEVMQQKYEFLRRTAKDLEEKLEKEKTKYSELMSCREISQAFNSGSEQDRAAVIDKCFNKAVSAKDEIIIGVRHKGGNSSAVPKVLRVNAVFGDNANESTISGNFFNKSLHGTLVTDDEEDFLNHSSLPRRGGDSHPFPETEDDREERLLELNRRNTLCQPHLRTCYAVETQGYTVDRKRKIEEDASVKKQSSNDMVTPPNAKRFTGIFKTPKSLHRLMQRRDAEKKKIAGIQKQRFKF